MHVYYIILNNTVHPRRDGQVTKWLAPPEMAVPGMADPDQWDVTLDYKAQFVVL